MKKIVTLSIVMLICIMTLCGCSDDKIPLAEFVESKTMNEELQDICKAAGENVNVVAYAEGKELKIEKSRKSSRSPFRGGCFCGCAPVIGLQTGKKENKEKSREKTERKSGKKISKKFEKTVDICSPVW